MIFWEQYKKLKIQAERELKIGVSDDFDVLIVILEFQQGKFTRDDAIEKIIDALSGGEHLKPL